MIKLKIFNPIIGKGVYGGRDYVAMQGEEHNDKDTDYVELGCIVRDENGKNLHDLTVEVTCTDDTQDKTLVTTGNVTNVYVGEGREATKESVYYYAIHYKLKFTGVHSVTFTCQGASKKKTFNVK